MKKRVKLLLSCGLVITALATVGPMVGIAGSMESQEEMQMETIVKEQGEEIQQQKAETQKEGAQLQEIVEQEKGIQEETEKNNTEKIFPREENTEEVLIEVPMKESVESQELAEEEQVEESVGLQELVEEEHDKRMKVFNFLYFLNALF